MLAVYRRACGFTLIEVLVVVAIMASLTGFALLSLSTDRAQAGPAHCEQKLAAWFTQVQQSAVAHRQNYFIAVSESGLWVSDSQAQPAPLPAFVHAQCEIVVEIPENGNEPGFMAATADGRLVSLHDDLVLEMAHGDRWHLTDLLAQPIWRY